jgi:hypothetical protein
LEGQLNLDPDLLGYKIDFLIPVLNPENFEDGKKEDVDYLQNYILESDQRFDNLNSI